MTVTFLTPKGRPVSRWAGGRTAQICIFPEGADYQKRDFLWRVSSAEVELPRSEFTPLSGFTRYISTLSGQISLFHGDAPEVRLAPYRVHLFDGGEKTVCLGKCRDLNLMLKTGEARGDMESRSLTPRPSRLLCGEYGTALLFCARGRASVEAAGARHTLGPGDALLLENAAGESLSALGPARVFLCRMEKCRP